MLIVFVVDIKLIFGYDSGAPLNISSAEMKY